MHTTQRRLLAVLVGALFASSVTAAVLTPQAEVAGLVQRPDVAACLVGAVAAERANHGVGPLQTDPRLNAAAEHHSTAMAQRDDLHHSDLAGYPGAAAGENVATHTSADCAAVAARLAASPEHQANTTDPGWRYVGAGAVVADGVLWATVAFTTPPPGVVVTTAPLPPGPMPTLTELTTPRPRPPCTCP